LKLDNFCLIFGETSGLPISYISYKSGINDILPLINAAQNISLIYNKPLRLVLDSELFHQTNINILLTSKYNYDFIIRLPENIDLNKELITSHKSIINNIQYVIMYNNSDVIWTTKQKIRWSGNRFLTAHIFNDPTYNDRYRDKLVQHINIMWENAKQNPKEFVSDPDYNRVLNFQKSQTSKTGYSVTKNNDAYTDLLTQYGWDILLTNCDISSLQALEIYKYRELVERSFEILKVYYEKNDPTFDKYDIFHGLFSVSFLSLILIARINKVMKDNKLYRDVTMEEMLDHLSALKAIIINDKYIVDNLTDTQETFFKKFSCPLPQTLS
jgi:transposase